MLKRLVKALGDEGHRLDNRFYMHIGENIAYEASASRIQTDTLISPVLVVGYTKKSIAEYFDKTTHPKNLIYSKAKACHAMTLLLKPNDPIDLDKLQARCLIHGIELVVVPKPVRKVVAYTPKVKLTEGIMYLVEDFTKHYWENWMTMPAGHVIKAEDCKNYTIIRFTKQVEYETRGNFSTAFREELDTLRILIPNLVAVATTEMWNFFKKNGAKTVDDWYDYDLIKLIDSPEMVFRLMNSGTLWPQTFSRGNLPKGVKKLLSCAESCPKLIKKYLKIDVKPEMMKPARTLADCMLGINANNTQRVRAVEEAVKKLLEDKYSKLLDKLYTEEDFSWLNKISSNLSDPGERKEWSSPEALQEFLYKHITHTEKLYKKAIK